MTEKADSFGRTALSSITRRIKTAADHTADGSTRRKLPLFIQEVDCVLRGHHSALGEHAFVDAVIAAVLRMHGADMGIAAAEEQKNARDACQVLSLIHI